jgi:hydrogenase maturation protease
MGVELLEYLKEYERVVIIDAADMGLPPGTVKVFTPDEVASLKSDKTFSLHSTDVLGVIELGKTLGEKMAEVTIVAVQPEFVGPREELSPSVNDAVGPAVNEALRVVRGLTK